MEVYLIPITRHNWQEALALQVLPDQERFVASNLYSLAQAKVEPEWNCRAIMLEESFPEYLRAICGQRSHVYRIGPRLLSGARRYIWQRRRMVGFIMDGYQTLGEPLDGYWITRFMLAPQYQNRGLGRLAMAALLTELRRSGFRKLYISFVPENAAAAKLYSRFGFCDTGQMDDDEVVYCLNPESPKEEDACE